MTDQDRGTLSKPAGSRSDRLLGLVAFVCAALLLAMPQLKIRALHTSFFDLGQYTTNIAAIAFDSGSGWALRGHAHLLADLYALVYALHASPATLLAIQSAILVFSALLAGRVYADFGAGRFIEGAALYLLSISVWFSALFDFHFEHLIFPLFFLAMLASRKDGLAAQLTTLAAGLALCLVKEPYALMAGGFGLYLVLARRWYVTGAVMMVLAAVYFLAITQIVIPYYSGGRQSGDLWSSAFGYLGNSVPEMIASMLANPLQPLAVALEPRKIVYMLALGGAFAFVFLRAPAIIITALPILGLSLISLNPNHSYLGNQYSVGVTAVLFVATAIGLGRFRAALRLWLRRAVFAGAVIVLVLFGPAPISRLFVQNATFAYGYDAYLPSERDAWIERMIDATLPADPQVVVSTQNTVVTTRLADRYDFVAFPDGVFDTFASLYDQQPSVPFALAVALTDRGGRAKIVERHADWVVLDHLRPPYLKDQGCDWLYGACTAPDIKRRFDQETARLAETFDLILSEDGFEIYRRK